MASRKSIPRIRMLALGCETAGVILLQWTVRVALNGEGFSWGATLAGIALVALGILLFFVRIPNRGR